jgi:predicted dehydrogenase
VAKMKESVKWGVLSTAAIGVEKVIPAMQAGEYTHVEAVASRNPARAQEIAQQLQIPKAYGSYEELLEDPEIEVVYIPLPNHLHLPWIEKSVRAGKHVLCEKPIVLNSGEIEHLRGLQDQTGKLIGEGFMVLYQRRWDRVREIVRSGSLGRFVTASSIFSFYQDDENNIRNRVEYGGGGMYDIGCYPIVISRYVLGEEPLRVGAYMQHDPRFGVDRLASVVLEYPSGPVSFTVSTQMVSYQTFQFFGTEKMIEVQIPYNTPPFRSMSIRVNSGDLFETSKIAESFAPENQYTREVDAFSRAVLTGEAYAGSLDNAEKNLKVIEAVFSSARSGGWVSMGQ